MTPNTQVQTCGEPMPQCYRPHGHDGPHGDDLRPLLIEAREALRGTIAGIDDNSCPCPGYTHSPRCECDWHDVVAAGRKLLERLDALDA